MINLEILLDVSEIGGKAVNQDRKTFIVDKENDMALILVADGVGGSKQGEIAAQIIVDTAHKLWEKRQTFDSPKLFLEQLANQANEQISTQADNAVKTASTLCAFAIWPDACVSVHAGDSRIYQLNQDGVVKHTKDHSLAFSKFLMGELTKKELATHPTQNQLLSCLDGGDPSLEFTEWSIENNDTIVVCSDGFWEVYTDEELDALIKNPDRKMFFINHFDEVLEARPKHDNTTALIATVTGLGDSASPQTAGSKTDGSKAETVDNNSKHSDSSNSNHSEASSESPSSSKGINLILIGAVLVLLVLIYFIFSGDDSSQQTPTEPQSQSTPQSQTDSSADNTSEAEEEKSSEGQESDSAGSNSAESDSEESDSKNSESQDSETNTDDSARSEDDASVDDSNESPSDDVDNQGGEQTVPDINDGLDDVGGVKIEIKSGEDIKSQIKDQLVQRKIISKESEVILGKAQTDQYSTVRDVKISINGIPVFGAQVKLIKTEKGFEVVTGKLVNITAPSQPPAKDFNTCLNQHVDLALTEGADARGKLYLDAKTAGYLWMGYATEIDTNADYRVLVYDDDCQIKLKEPLMISQGGGH